jgi:hypothetical protein
MGIVTLKVDGLKERDVFHLNYDLRQETDIEGQPAAVVRGGKMQFKVKSTNDGNTEFLEWMCDPFGFKSGSIEFVKRDGTNMKTLKFMDAILVAYEEIFDALDESSQFELFTISAKHIEMGAAVHENKWTE